VIGVKGGFISRAGKGAYHCKRTVFSQGVFLPSTRSLNQILRNSDRTLFLPQLAPRLTTVRQPMAEKGRSGYQGHSESRISAIDSASPPTLQHSNTPTLQYSNTPILQYSNTPILQYSNTPTVLEPSSSSLTSFLPGPGAGIAQPFPVQDLSSDRDCRKAG
jgi:hypothetical protein